MRGEIAQRDPRVGNDDQRQAGGIPEDFGAFRVHDRRHRAMLPGSCDEIVPVESVAAQGDEQFAGAYFPAVGRHPVKRPPLADDRTGHRFGGSRQIHFYTHACFSCRKANAAMASSRSENGRFTPAIS